MYIHKSINIYICIYKCICVCIYTYIYMYINTYIQDTWNKDDIPDTSKIDGDLTSLGFENSVWVNVILSSLWNVENIGGVGI
jgi:hypothetical protein